MSYNKFKCATCRYHSTLGSSQSPSTNADKALWIENHIHCYYSVLSGKGTALKRGPHGEVIDTRGDDPENCRLYEEGTPDRQIPPGILPRR